MKIAIAERLHPFTHRAGDLIPLPGSTLGVQIFPARINLFDLNAFPYQQMADLPLDITGPVDKFTVEQDLEHGFIRVWGDTPHGFFRYRLQALQSGGVQLTSEKGNLESGAILGTSGDIYMPPKTDRLSLGNHKKQEWELIHRRGDLTEILPLWHRLGQMIPDSTAKGGSYALLEACHEAPTLEVCQTLLNLFHAGFSGALAPRLVDTQHQGFNLPDPSGSPLALLTEGAAFIRSLFVRVEENRIEVLPKLPSEFHCGRLIDVTCGSWGTLHIEWSKKTIRRVVFTAAKTGELQFAFQNKVKSCRLRHLRGEKGERLACPITLDVEEGKQYLFDNFMR